MEEIIKYEYYTESGNSGSLLWYKSGDEYFVVGIHIEGNSPYRKGCRLSFVFKQIRISCAKKNSVFRKFYEIEGKGAILNEEQKLEEEERYENSLS